MSEWHHVSARRCHVVRLVVALGLSAGLVACSSGQSEVPADTSPAMKSAEARAQWYQECWDHYSNQAWDRFPACYAENATSETADSPDGPHTGRAAIAEVARKETATFSDRRGELKLVLGNGSRLAGIALWMGTNNGPFPPGPDGQAMPATNKKVGMLMGHLLELDATGSSAARDIAFVDEGAMMAQLGISPQPARPVMAATGAPPTVVIAKNDDTENRNVSAIRASFDSFNAHDVSIMETALADNYTLHESGLPADADKKASIASTKDFFTAFPDIRATVTDIWGAGEYVVATGSIAGTNTGPAPGMGITKPTGKPVNARFLEIFRLQDGKIVEDWLFYNGAAFAAQLGLK